MKTRHLFALVLVTCLLTGCGGIAWNFSDRVAELPESCVGVEITKPVGGAVYVPEGQERVDNPSLIVMQVPEISYSPRTHITCSGSWAFMERLTASEVKPTGRQLWVQLPGPRSGLSPTPVKVLPDKPASVSLRHGDDLSYRCLVPAEDAAAAGKDIIRCRLVPHEGSEAEKQELLRWYCPGWGGRNPKGIACLKTERSAWGPLANAASAPLFVLDCALGIATNGAAIAIALPLAPLTAPFLQQQPEAKPDSTPAQP